MSKTSENIRNFLITAHIDHGKSTLADRMLEITGTIEKRSMKPQFLDQLELERERGITIKMAPVRMVYRSAQFTIYNSQFSKKLEIENSKIENLGSEYILNLIDTPGHSDFAYEVSRALMAVEGAVLLVDATQGIQAQTLANFEGAKKAGLVIIGAVNKIDVALPEQIENAVGELAELLGHDKNEILKVSGKTGEGVPELLVNIIEKIPSPKPTSHIPHSTSSDINRALIFDSLYDEHKGVIAFIRVVNGEFSAEGGSAFGGKIMRLLATEAEFKAKEVGIFSPKLKPTGILHEGEIGYIATGIKDLDKLKIGDTLLSNTSHLTPNIQQLALPGYKEPKSVVFVSFYPEESDNYDELKKALGKLRLTDSSLIFEADFSEVLGRGFKGGFLGRLHFEITAERLAREFNINTVHSFPSVAYRVKRKARPGETPFDWEIITNPKDFPDEYAEVEEPITKVEILTPTKYLGDVLSLTHIFRFSGIETKNIGDRILITARLPLSDLIHDLDDKLKSASAGFASLSYELAGYERGEVAKLEVLVTGQAVAGLTRILPQKDVEREARSTVEKLKNLLPRQNYTQALQAASGGRIIARETIPAMQKLLGSFGKTGGDRTRKMKLWKKQQRGKKRLKERAEQSQIKIPANVFKELLKK